MIGNTYLQKLEIQLETLLPVIYLLLNNSSIKAHHRGGIGHIDLGYAYEWDKKDELNQIEAKKIFSAFQQSVRPLYNNFNTPMIEEMGLAEYSLTTLIEQTDAPASIDISKKNVENSIQIFKKFFDFLKKDNPDIIIIPDTNAIIQYPNPSDYRKLTNSSFSIIFLPTVLSELDKLKVNHKNDEFKKKAQSIIRRLKGYRNQGDILKGVIIDKNIIVKMVAVEPDFTKTLSWLDANNQDDRIVASALSLQAQNPCDRIILITSDLNLQNKAQMASLTFADTDDLE
jgi:rRNA-processing protein FCF1